jgi:hypothetical protein
MLLGYQTGEPENVQEPANEQERDRASHVDHRGRRA